MCMMYDLWVMNNVWVNIYNIIIARIHVHTCWCMFTFVYTVYIIIRFEYLYLDKHNNILSRTSRSYSTCNGLTFTFARWKSIDRKNEHAICRWQCDVTRVETVTGMQSQRMRLKCASFWIILHDFSRNEYKHNSFTRNRIFSTWLHRGANSTIGFWSINSIQHTKRIGMTHKTANINNNGKRWDGNC